jgi:hypothetical protein
MLNYTCSLVDQDLHNNKQGLKESEPKEGHKYLFAEV